MAQIICDGTEGNFLLRVNELLETNGFSKMPFSPTQLRNRTSLRNDPNIEVRLPEKERKRTKVKNKGLGQAHPRKSQRLRRKSVGKKDLTRTV